MQSTQTATTRLTGTVKFFDRLKGWGFIEPDDGLLELQADGYHVPEFALEAIREELNEENDETIKD